MANDTGTVLVRVKPFNPRKDQVAKRIMFRGRRFEADRGWYEVPASLGQELAELKHPGNDAAIFDVASAEEARGLERRERSSAQGIASARNPQRVVDVRPTPAEMRTNGMDKEAAQREHARRKAALGPNQIDLSDLPQRGQQRRPARKVMPDELPSSSMVPPSKPKGDDDDNDAGIVGLAEHEAIAAGTDFDEDDDGLDFDDVGAPQQIDLSKMSKTQLTDLARDRGIKVEGNWSKGELADAIERGASGV